MTTRRTMLAGLAALATPRLTLADDGDALTLTARPAAVDLGAGAMTRVWGYDGVSPGPTLRVRAGGRLRVRFRNALEVPSAVHWHGVRLANAMDGVPYLTQPPVPSGGEFLYDFVAPDAGTFWYHAHMNGWEQVARGLYGPLIVADDRPEAHPGPREVTVMLDDWRLDDAGQIHESFDSGHDASHGGRLGNWLTANGATEPALDARPGETLRLRLISAANARIMAFDLGRPATVIALDGAALETPQALEGPLTLAPAQRADVVLTLPPAPGEHAVREISTGEPVTAFRLRAAGEPAPAAARADPAPWGQAEPEMAAARRIPVVMEGGAMRWLSGAVLDGETLDGRALAGRGRFWAFNGVADMAAAPLAEARVGETLTLAVDNRTRWRHAMHLHGQHFRVTARDGAPVREPWRDTVLIVPDERLDLSFRADAPGDWLFHCHMLAHAESGMRSWIRVRG